MAAHNATQDLLPNNLRFDLWRKIAHQGLNSPARLSIASMAGRMTAEGQNTGSIAFAENPSVPAGYTFLGQWLAHDITIARNLGLSTPQLRLLSLYGAGPSGLTGAYAHYPSDFNDPAMCAAHIKMDEQYEIFRHAKFKLKHEGADQYDVPRLPDNIAIMADSRNDQHMILCELHCAFARFHNALTEWLHYLNYPYTLMSPNGVQIKGQQLFTLAREIAVWCYQRVLVEDYLPLLLHSPQVINQLIRKNPAFILFNEVHPPQIMPEFSLAAMRVGHSQTKEVYQVNRAGDRLSIFSNRKAIKDLAGFQKHDALNFEWDVFFKMGKTTPQASGAIDRWIARPLAEMPFQPKGANSLPAINLERSEILPAGDALAGAAKFALPSIPATFGFGTTDIPLWLYIMLEAELTQHGKRLGKLGSQIIAEQIMWVLRHDPMSFYSKDNTCDTLEKFVQELFRRYNLDNFFGSPTVLTEGLQKLGMEEKKLGMPWVINFPKNVIQEIESLRNTLDDYGNVGPAQEDIPTSASRSATSPDNQTLNDRTPDKAAQAFIRKWLGDSLTSKKKEVKVLRSVTSLT